MKRLAVLIVFCIMAGMVFPGGVQAATTFTDTKTHWAKDYIATVANAGFVSGYTDGSFKPDKTVSRAEFTTVMIRCLGYEPSTGTNYFSDMKSHWAKGYVNQAVALGIVIPGDYGSNFGPNTGFKRSEVCAMLVRALGKQPDNGAMSFKDSANLNQSRYRGYIKVATDLKLLSGYPNGNFEPFQEVTRAQMCKVIINFMETQGKSLALSSSATTTTPATTPASNTLLGDFATLAIGDQEYNLSTTPVIFKIELTNVTVTSLTKQQGYLFINGQYRYALDSTVSKIDVIVNNTRYPVNQFSTSTKRLIIYPGNRKMASITVANHKYDADYVNLYINSTSKGYYLSDMAIIDSATVEVAGKKYFLPSDKITAELGTDFYDITGFTLSSSATTPALTKTDPVIARGYKISDISAIFVGATTFNLSTITSIQFLTDSKLYSLSEIEIDASDNIICDHQTYASNKVVMVLNGTQYGINHVTLTNGKLIFYCGSETSSDLVYLNSKYRDKSSVSIIKDGIVYDLDHMVIVSKNVLRVNGKQYSLDSTFKVSFDGNTYYIDEVNYDNTLHAPIINTSSKATDSSQPLGYNFYLNNSLYRSGASTDTTIYTSNKWISFSQITIFDPSRYTYNSSTYNLVGALVQIGNKEYKITDTAWRGSSHVLDLYLQEV